MNYISKNMILSEEWIHANKEKVNWKYISQYQDISPDFIDEHKNYVDIDIILDKNKFIRNYPKFCSVYRIRSNQDTINEHGYNYRYLRNFFEERDIMELEFLYSIPNRQDHERITMLIRNISSSNPRRGRLQRRYGNFMRSFSTGITR